MRISAAGNEADRHLPLEAGVTLLELVIVLALISLVVALVAPQFGNWMDEWRLRSAAQQVAQAVDYARTRAVFEQSYYVVEIDPRAERVRIFEPSSGFLRQFVLPSDVKVDDGEEPRPAVVRLLLSPSGGVEERNLWLSDRRGKTFRLHVDFLLGSATIEAVNHGAR